MADVKNLHFNVVIISRSGSARGTGNQKKGTGKPGFRERPPNAVAAAAYRSGQKLVDEQIRESFDYSPEKVAALSRDARHAAAYRAGAIVESDGRKAWDYTRKEHVVYSAILAPNGAPGWARDRQSLWNKVEAAENRSNRRAQAQLARDIIATLPRGLSRNQQIALVHEFVRLNFTRYGMVADVNIHEKEASDGGTHPHLHCMLTTRELLAEDFGKKRREWNYPGNKKFGIPSTVENWRASFEELANKYLEEAGSDTRVCLKSFARQGIDKEPQKPLGYAAWNLEKRGVETRHGDTNRRTVHRNVVHEIATSLYAEDHADGWPGAPGTLEIGTESMPVSGSLSPAEFQRRAVQEILGRTAALSSIAVFEMVRKVDDFIVAVYDEAADIGWESFDQPGVWNEPEGRTNLPQDRETGFER